MAETIRDAVLKISLDAQEAKKETKEYASVVDDASKQSVSDFNRIQDSVKKLTEQENKLKEAAEKRATEIQDANLKVGDSAKTAGEGLFTLARGLAFVGASSEESFEQALRTIAKFQGAFDIFKGGTDTIKALVEGTRALKIATGAATVVEGLHAISIRASAAAANIATASFTAMKVALGPVGLAILALGASLAIGAGAYSAFTDSIGDNSKSLEENRKQLQASRQGLADRVVAFTKDFGTVAEQIDAIEESIQSLKDITPLQFDFGSQENLEFEEKIRSRQKDILALLERQTAEKQKQIDKARTSLSLAKQAFDEEQKRVQSLQERVGRLSPEEFEEFRGLSRAVGRGQQLSTDQLRRLESLGGTGTAGFVGQRFADIGERRGGAQLFDPFGNRPNVGEGSKLQELQQSFRQLNQQVPDFVAQVQQEIIESNTRREQALTELFEFLSGFIATKSDLESIKDKLQEAENNRQR